MLNTRLRRLLGAATAALVVPLGLAACSNDSTDSTKKNADGAASTAANFPVEFKNDDGTTTTIPAKPKRIMSTSVTVTGTLIAFDAPVVSSAISSKGDFFAQWAKVAEAKKIQKAWPTESVNLEDVHAANPDLIVVSTAGADSLLKQVTELQAIAPTIVVDYSKQSWQELAVQLGKATGMQEQVKKLGKEYDDYLAAAAAKIKVPSGTANIVSYNGPTDKNPIGKASGPHAQILTSLGFKIEDPNEAWHGIAQKRSDFVFASYDNLTQLKGETTFVLQTDNEGAKKMTTDPVLANLPSVKSDQVFGLGKNSFRVDYYSAKEIIDEVVQNFSK